MKKILGLFLCFYFYFTFTINAQNSNDVGKIALSVIMPENVDGLDASQLSKLETKITQIVSASGLAASGYNNNFVIYPKFAIYETNVVEGGMQNITVTTCELSMFIKQVDNNILFASISKQVKGSGNNKQTSITNSISKIPVNDPQFKTFIETGKQKIIAYYEANCDGIIAKADAMTKKQDYEGALGTLMSVPSEVSGCYNKAQEKSIGIYKDYQNATCAKMVQEAKTKQAANDYQSSLDILSQIDPTSKCNAEAQTLVKTASSKIDAEAKKQWDFKMQQYNDAVGLEKQRVNAIKEVAVAYYKSKPTTVNYTTIIK